MGKFTYKPQWGIVVIAKSEEHQKQIYEKLSQVLKDDDVKLKIVAV